MAAERRVRVSLQTKVMVPVLAVLVGLPAIMRVIAPHVNDVLIAQIDDNLRQQELAMQHGRN